MKVIIGNVNTSPSCSCDPSLFLCLYIELGGWHSQSCLVLFYLSRVPGHWFFFNNKCFMPPVPRRPPKTIFL